MAAIAKRLAAQQTPGRFPTALDCNLGIEGHGVDPDIEFIVSQTTLAEAFTSGKLNSGKETGYGFGWVVERSKNKGLAVSHGGLWVGFRTSIERQVDRRLTVIVLSNNSTSNLDQVLQAIEELQ